MFIGAILKSFWIYNSSHFMQFALRVVMGQVKCARSTHTLCSFHATNEGTIDMFACRRSLLRSRSRGRVRAMRYCVQRRTSHSRAHAFDCYREGQDDCTRAWLRFDPLASAARDGCSIKSRILCSLECSLAHAVCDDKARAASCKVLSRADGYCRALTSLRHPRVRRSSRRS